MYKKTFVSKYLTKFRMKYYKGVWRNWWKHGSMPRCCNVVKLQHFGQGEDSWTVTWSDVFSDVLKAGYLQPLGVTTELLKFQAGAANLNH